MIGTGLLFLSLLLPFAEAEETATFNEYAPLTVFSGTVIDISFQGVKRIDPFVLRSALQVSVGEQYVQKEIQGSILAIYRTGYFEDVRVEGFESEAGIKLVFTVTEKAAIRSVTLKGNKKLDDDALLEVMDIEATDIVNQTEIRRNIERMRAKYTEKGYYLVEIDPVLTALDDDTVELVFEVTENRKVLVSKIEISGNEAIRSSKIRRFLQTRQAGLIPFMGGGSFDETTLDTDMQVIRSVFMEEGFVDVKVSPPHSFLSLDKKYISISVDIEEGKQYKIGKVNVKGDFVEEEGLSKDALRAIIDGEMAKDITERWNGVLKDLGGEITEASTIPEDWEETSFGALDFRTGHAALETGDIFKLSSLQMCMQEISNLYGDQGYAFVNVIPVTDTDLEAGVVDITFDIQKGNKVKIGRIDISGNDPTFDKVVRREIPINEGDLYSGTGIEESRQRLNRLGFFEIVEISTPRSTDNPEELDMKVSVSEQPTGSFSIGAGFSNLENFVFTANISKNNFLGLGYVMAISANVSSLKKQGNVQIYDPYFLDSRWTLRVNGYALSQQFIEEEYQRGGSLAVGRYLDRRDDWRFELDYTFEDTGINSIDAYKKKLLGGQLYRNGLTSTGGLSFLVDKRNNRINATKGIYAVASANLSGGFRTSEDEILSVFGGQFNFLETKFNLRGYYPLFEGDRVVLRYNGTLGAIKSTDGSVVPYIHRYRAGGINSIRGYGWYTLGPDMRANGYYPSATSMFQGSDDPAAGDARLVVGGTQTWINNFEMEIPIIPAAGIRTVIFFDAGNAFGDPWGNGSINIADMRLAYGAGVRWLSPMGPLRFEWGFPINPYPEERKMVFDFSMGSLF